MRLAGDEKPPGNAHPECNSYHRSPPPNCRFTPALVESNPLPGSNLTTQDGLTLTFSQAMARASVEAALQFSPRLSGSFEWLDDSSVRFLPLEVPPPGSDLIATLAPTAAAINGKTLTQTVELAFRIPPYLEITQQLPAPDATDVDPAAAVVVAFSQPVVPLGGNADTLPPALRLQPAALGRGEWLNTSTYIFYPDPPLLGGVSYTASLDLDLSSAEGAALHPQNLLAWNFTTAAPRLLSFEPDGSQSIPLDQIFSLTFNQPMDSASVEAGWQLSDGRGNLVNGKFSWSDDLSAVSFEPNILLARNTTYKLALSGEARGRSGTPLGEGLQVSFTSVPQLAISQTRPAAAQTLEISDGFGSLMVEFSAPLADQPLKSRLTVAPPIASPSVYLAHDRRTAHISGFWQPSTAYTLTADTALRDAWGQTLGSPQNFSFRTSPAKPNLSLPSLDQGASTVHLMPDDPALAAQVTNLNRLQISSAPLDLPTYLQRISQIGTAQSEGAPQQAVAWQQRLTTGRDVSEVVEVNLTPNGEALSPGLYAFEITSDELVDPFRRSRSFLAVASRINLTLKRSAHQLLIWAVDLEDKQPLAGAHIRVYTGERTLVASACTDDEGVSIVPLPDSLGLYDPLYVVTGSPGEPRFGLATDSWQSGISGWDFGINAYRQRDRAVAYLYTDRPIYRPGQTVHLRALVHHRSNGRYSPTQLEQVTLRIKSLADGWNNPDPTLETIKLPLSDYGSASASFTLPPHVLPGSYLIEVDEIEDALLFFEVSAYRKPEIELQVAFERQDYQAGDTMNATVQADYYFGAPADRLPLRWALYALPAYLDLPGGFQSGTQDSSWYFPRQWNIFGSDPGKYISGGEGRTDGDGSFQVIIPAAKLGDGFNWQNTARLTLEVTLLTDDEAPLTARAETRLHPADHYIGVRPETWSGVARRELGYTIQTVNWQGAPSGNHGLQARFDRITWKEEAHVLSASGFRLLPELTPVSSADLRTDEQGRARLAFTPFEPGLYQLEVRSEGAITQVWSWVGGEGSPAYPALPNQRLQLTANAAAYRPGQTASIFIPNPLGRDTLALITVERNRVISHQVLKLSGFSHTHTLEIGADEAPNVYVAVTLVGNQPDGKPDFRVGLLELKVEPLLQQLQVEMQAQPARSHPGGEVAVEINVRAPDGRPVQGEFSLALVDKAVLALADPNAPTIVAAFYSQQPLGVTSSLSLAAYGRRIALSPAANGLGGGGDATPLGVRQQFEDTAFWNGSIETDRDGRAALRIRLPDNLTTWVATLRGLTRHALVGEANAEIVTSKDLMLRPLTPRFLVAGDHVALSAMVHNQTGTPLSVEVGLQADGFTLDQPARAVQRVQVAAGGRQSLTWWGRAGEVEAVRLLFTARAGNHFDAVRPAQGALPVLRYHAPQTFATSGVLTEGGERLEVVALPRSYTPTAGELRLELAPSLAAAMLEGLEALEAFPADYTEPVLSRLLPNLEARRTLAELGLEPPRSRVAMDDAIEDGLRRLVRAQNSDGGWGWRSGRPSDPYLSAYALLALGRAAEEGAAVDTQVISRAQDYLLANLPLPGTQLETQQRDRLAFQYFSLQMSGVDVLDADWLYSDRQQLSPWSAALLALTLHEQDPGNRRARALIMELQGAARRSASGAHWEADTSPSAYHLNSAVFNTAIALYSLARLDPASPLLNDALRYLVHHRRPHGSWSSSHESAWVLIALNETLKGTAELQADYDYRATLNNTPLAEGQAGGVRSLTAVTAAVPLSTLQPKSGNLLRITRSEGLGRLYYRSFLQLFQPVQNAPPLQRGLALQRSYHPANVDCRQERCEVLESLSLADGQPIVQVRLTLTLPETMHFLVVEDYIPAGTEIIDPKLNTSPADDADLPYDPRNPFAFGWGWWYFDPPQIFDDHIRWIGERLPPGSYELSYRLLLLHAGEFQVLPAQAYQSYFPEVEARSAGSVLNILP